MEKQTVRTPIRSDFSPILVGVNLQAEFVKFAIWFGTPRSMRDPKTQREFAATIGISEDTLTDWKRRPEFAPLVWRAMREWIAERVPDVLEGLYDKACTKGNAKEVEMFLKIAGMDIKSEKKNKI
ncbi:MAG: hypothetical protein KGH79_04555 [Patescibacteria group bacterium]|nr:hypothetical protein [Patescibacteria group bacterium]